MAKAPSFNFGANRKPRKTKARKGGKKARGSKSNAWRAYISNVPIPD